MVQVAGHFELLGVGVHLHHVQARGRVDPEPIPRTRIHALGVDPHTPKREGLLFARLPGFCLFLGGFEGLFWFCCEGGLPSRFTHKCSPPRISLHACLVDEGNDLKGLPGCVSGFGNPSMPQQPPLSRSVAALKTHLDVPLLFGRRPVLGYAAILCW